MTRRNLRLGDGQITEIANTGGIPAGLQCDRDNHIWIADMKQGRFL